MSKPIEPSTGEEKPVGSRSRWRGLWRLIFLIVVVVVGLVWWTNRSRNPVADLAQARALLADGHVVEAVDLAKLAFNQSEGDSVIRGEAAVLVARIAEQNDDLQDAASWYDRVPDRSPEFSSARASSGLIYAEKLHRLGDAIDRFATVAERDPGSLVARRRLAQVLGLANRTHEAQEHLVALVRLGNISHLELLLLVLGEETIDDVQVVERYQKAAPSDPHPLIGLARLAAQAGKMARARELLQEAITLDGELVEPVVRLGALLVETRDFRGLLNWEQELVSMKVKQHPGGQVVRGDMFRLIDAPRRAARCYLDAVRMDPNRPEACYRLGRILVSLGQSDQATEFLQRARQVEAYVQAAKVANGAETIADVARQAAALSLPWEEFAWTALQSTTDPNNRQLAEKLTRLKDALAGLPDQRIRPGTGIAQRLDLTGYPQPELSDALVARLDQGDVADDQVADRGIRFEETAMATGLNFRFVNGANRAEDIRFMYQTTGGGVAAVDYDRDGWPDLWWTQGADQPTVRDGKHSDALFLNTGDGRVIDVTIQAGVAENRFSQGVAVGDIDADGFPDILVANLVENRLWLNNGDGTFTAAELGGPGRNRWTTSCLVADLDGDGLPDLYEVNYLAGEDVFTRRCRESDGTTGICTPQTFSGSLDRTLRNLGDGQFEDVSSRWKLQRPGGSGLGVVAARLGTSTPPGRLDLFIANDTRANFLYRPGSSGDKSSSSAWRDTALQQGLALNDAGRAEACMGIAVGDVDGDGRLDLFVTNFIDETNTLYRQNERGGFSDRTRAAGLESPSRAQLGFGTQFLDLDLDGVLDLVVTNGHIENNTAKGQPFRMPPQVFWNDGSGRFHLLDADKLGDFFSGRYLGRGLARLDFNRDGAADIAISHVGRPAALLINRTVQRGHHVVVRLVGTRGNRDAIGTTLMYHLGSRRVVRQLTAGDGFQASNQRVVVLGLGASGVVPPVEVTWPSGTRQVFDGLPMDGEVVLVEGRSRAFRLPGPESTGR
ncbi:MAG: hypothetical protein CMJ68_02435 [Planctomycetaceae bacterium]|nr:hypothetical protein [Planctomycetaceae bacterium]